MAVVAIAVQVAAERAAVHLEQYPELVDWQPVALVGLAAYVLVAVERQPAMAVVACSELLVVEEYFAVPLEQVAEWVVELIAEQVAVANPVVILAGSVVVALVVGQLVAVLVAGQVAAVVEQAVAVLVVEQVAAVLVVGQVAAVVVVVQVAAVVE